MCANDQLVNTAQCIHYTLLHVCERVLPLKTCQVHDVYNATFVLCGLQKCHVRSASSGNPARVHLCRFPLPCFLCCLSTHCLNKNKQHSIWNSSDASPRAESLIMKFLKLFVEHHVSAEFLLVLSRNGRNTFELVMFPHVDEPLFFFVPKKLCICCKTSLYTLHNSFERFAQHGPAVK